MRSSTSWSSLPEQLFREFTRVQAVALVPELRLHLATELVPLWQTTEWRAAAPQPPPFWAFAWPGSIVLARYVLDHPEVVQQKRVLDLGSGSGLAAIAAARAGANRVLAYDLDPLASAAQARNMRTNSVDLIIVTGDALQCEEEVDVILAGDVCYEREPADHITHWLRDRAREGVCVLLADPGRHYVPSHGLQPLEAYEVPTLHELESAPSKRTNLWALSPEIPPFAAPS